MIETEGSSVLLGSTNWNTGMWLRIPFAFDGEKPATDFIRDELGRRTSLPIVSSLEYCHDFTEGEFTGWRLSAYKAPVIALVFVLPVPTTELRIVLQKWGALDLATHKWIADENMM